MFCLRVRHEGAATESDAYIGSALQQSPPPYGGFLDVIVNLIQKEI
jgi:hypothetical protein